MKFASAVTSERNTELAARQILESVRAELGGARADLVLVFASPHHRPKLEALPKLIAEVLSPGQVLGCTADGVIGAGHEVEGQPALSLWAAHMPDVQILTFHLTFQQTRDGGFFTGWPAAMPAPDDVACLLLLPEPFSVPGDLLLEQLNDEYPGKPVIGGMASGAAAPGDNALFWNDRVLNEGVVGAVLTGNVRLHTVVSQGCRPIGKHFVVTKAEGNVIHTLGGRPALAQLQDVFSGLPPQEQRLARQALHLGRAINEYQESFGRGDFLVRNLIDADQQSGAIAAADLFRAGQTVQFHVRDADSAREDLRELLRKANEGGGHGAGGALLFSCNGRGQRLFGQPDQDVGALGETVGAIPVAGFFAQGEIGPVGGKNFLHGFTASVGLFLPKDAT